MIDRFVDKFVDGLLAATRTFIREACDAYVKYVEEIKSLGDSGETSNS